MKWINHFLNSGIPFYIYKLNKGDSIVCIKDTKHNKSIIILYGIVHVLKIFTNKEIITLAILEQENIIHNQIGTKNYYYKIIAIKETFLLCFKWKDIICKHYINQDFLIQFIKSYEFTIHKYEIMNQILAHKYIKYRIIQLILILSRDFGLINKKNIIIPFHISQITISLIIGSNKSTVNKILNNLRYNHAISYSYEKQILIQDPFILIYSQYIKK